MGWLSTTNWWYFIFPKFDLYTVSTRPNILYNTWPSPIGKLRCDNCWEICITTFHLLRYSSNTEIISFWRDGIKCNCRYTPYVLLGASTTLNWPWIWSLFWAVPLDLWNIPSGLDPYTWPSFTILLLSMRLFSHFFIVLAHDTLYSRYIYGSKISHIRNGWFRDLNNYSFQDWFIYGMGSENMERAAGEDVYNHPPWIPW